MCEEEASRGSVTYIQYSPLQRQEKYVCKSFVDGGRMALLYLFLVKLLSVCGKNFFQSFLAIQAIFYLIFIENFYILKQRLSSSIIDSLDITFYPFHIPQCSKAQQQQNTGHVLWAWQSMNCWIQDFTKGAGKQILHLEMGEGGMFHIMDHPQNTPKSFRRLF